jgi:hypothetical protein
LVVVPDVVADERVVATVGSSCASTESEDPDLGLCSTLLATEECSTKQLSFSFTYIIIMLEDDNNDDDGDASSQVVGTWMLLFASTLCKAATAKASATGCCKSGNDSVTLVIVNGRWRMRMVFQRQHFTNDERTRNKKRHVRKNT